MYKLLIRLMLITAAIQLGLSFKDITSCRSRECAGRLEKASRAVMHVDWKPISVWPEEAKRLRAYAETKPKHR